MNQMFFLVFFCCWKNQNVVQEYLTNTTLKAIIFLALEDDMLNYLLGEEKKKTEEKGKLLHL